MRPRVSLVILSLLVPLAWECGRSGMRAGDAKTTTAVRGDHHGDALPDRAAARFGTVRLRHGHEIHAVCFAPDGKTLASAGHDHHVRLWDASSAKAIRVFGAVDEKENAYAAGRWQHCVTFSRDGRLVAAGEHNVGWPGGAIRIWEADSGKEVKRLPGHTGGTIGLSFAPDGKTLASGGADGTIRLWDIVGDGMPRQLDGHKGKVGCVSYAADGKTLASAGADDHTLRFWDPARGAEIRQMDGFHGGCGSITFAPDGVTLAAAAADGLIQSIETANGKRQPPIKTSIAGARLLAYSPDGKSLAVAGSDGMISVRHIATHRDLHTLNVNSTTFTALAFSPKGTHLAAASAGIRRRVYLWDLTTGKEVGPAEGHEGGIVFLAYVDRGKTLVSAGGDQTLRVWDSATTRERRKHAAFQKPLPTIVARAVALTPDGKYVAVATPEGAIQLLDFESGKEQARCAGHADGVTAMAFTPDGRQLASGGMDRKLRFWDASNLREARASNLASPARFIVFAPDGKLMAINDTDSRVVVRDIDTGKERQRLEFEGTVASCAAFSPDGRHLAVGTWQSNVMVCDVARGDRLAQLSEHPGYVQSIAYSPDGRTLAVGSWSTVRLWETASFRLRDRILSDHGDVFAIAFAPDGKRLATGGVDTAIMAWELVRADAKPATMGELWKSLADDDAAVANGAMWSLQASPREAVPFLRAQLLPDGGPPFKRLSALIRDLDDDSFPVREKATEELERLGSVARPALRTALAAKPSLEVRLRINRLLEKLGGIQTPLRSLRAIEVLEYAATPEAAALLGRLAKGDPEDRMTQEATASWQRVMKSNAAPK